MPLWAAAEPAPQHDLWVLLETPRWLEGPVSDMLDDVALAIAQAMKAKETPEVTVFPLIDSALASVLTLEQLPDPAELVLAIMRDRGELPQRLRDVSFLCSHPPREGVRSLRDIATQVKSKAIETLSEPGFFAERLLEIHWILTRFVLNDDQLHLIPRSGQFSSARLELECRPRGYAGLRTPGRQPLAHVSANRRALEQAYPGLVLPMSGIPASLQPHRAFLQALVRWALRRKICDPWVITCVWGTLAAWSRRSGRPAHRWPDSLPLGGEGTPLHEIRMFQWQQGWGGQEEESWEAYARRAHAALDRWLASHKQKAAKGGKARAAAFEPRRLSQHARWLVLYQFGPEGVAGDFTGVVEHLASRLTEADPDPPAVSTVTKYVPKLAALAGMQIHEPRPGRHPGEYSDTKRQI